MKISIITVCYNSEKYLSTAIESVLNQTYGDIEYIIIDGGSNDSTLSIIKNYAPKFEGRLRWISDSDQGIYDAMNKGIAMASGEVVGILNSDDFYHRQDSIALIADCFLNNPEQAIIADLRYVKPNDLNKVVRKFSSKSFNPSKFRFGIMPAHPTFFTYKENYVRLGNYKINYQICADYELLIRFLLKNNISYKYLNVELLTMRTGGVSTNSLSNKLLITKEFLRACKENDIKTNYFLLSLRYIEKTWGLIRLKIA